MIDDRKYQGMMREKMLAQSVCFRQVAEMIRLGFKTKKEEMT